MEVERPTTSFTSKRQTRTSQENQRNQLNIGVLETDKPSISRPSTNPIQQPSNNLNSDRFFQQLTQVQRKKILFKPSPKFNPFLLKRGKKSTPKQHLYDQEKLYDDNLQTKQKFNTIKQENDKLKTQNQRLQDDILKLSKALKSIKSGRSGDNSLLESFFQESILEQLPTPVIIGLRNQIKELKLELEKKDQLIGQMQKSVRYTKLRETEVELAEFKKENFRLRTMIQQNFKMDKLLDQSQMNSESFNSALNTLKQDNIEMVAVIKQLEVDQEQLKIKFHEQQSQNVKIKNEKISLKRIIQQLQQDIDQLQSKDPFQQKQKEQINQIEIELQKDLDKARGECNQLNNQLMLKEKRIFELEKRLKELQRELQDSIQNYEIDKGKWRERLQKKTQEVEQLHSQLSQVTPFMKKRGLQSQHSFNDDRISDQIKKSQFASNNDSHIPGEIESSDGLKKVQTVKKEHVEPISKIIRYCLKEKKIPLKEIDQYLFEKELLEVGKISIEILEKRLRQNLFELNSQQSLKLARYLIEDNDEKHVIYNPKLETQIPRVRSILKQLIGNYEILSEEDEVTFYEEISTILQKFRISMIDYLTKGKEQQLKTCQFKNFEDALAFADVPLNQKQLDYVLQKNFFKTKDLNEIRFDELFEYFSGEQLQLLDQSEMIQSNYQEQGQKSIELNSLGVKQQSYADLKSKSDQIIEAKPKDDDSNNPKVKTMIKVASQPEGNNKINEKKEINQNNKSNIEKKVEIVQEKHQNEIITPQDQEERIQTLELINYENSEQNQQVISTNLIEKENEQQINQIDQEVDQQKSNLKQLENQNLQQINQTKDNNQNELTNNEFYEDYQEQNEEQNEQQNEEEIDHQDIEEQKQELDNNDQKEIEENTLQNLQQSKNQHEIIQDEINEQGEKNKQEQQDDEQKINQQQETNELDQQYEAYQEETNQNDDTEQQYKEENFNEIYEENKDSDILNNIDEKNNNYIQNEGDQNNINDQSDVNIQYIDDKSEKNQQIIVKEDEENEKKDQILESDDHLLKNYETNYQVNNESINNEQNKDEEQNKLQITDQ